MDSLDSAETLDRGQLPAMEPAALAPVEHDGQLTIRYKRRGNGLFMNTICVPVVLYAIIQFWIYVSQYEDSGVLLAIVIRKWPYVVMLSCCVIYWLMRQFAPKHQIQFPPG